MEGYKDEVGSLATVVTILQFLTGTTICRQFFRQGNTGEVSSAPFVAGALNGLVWCKYGLLKDDSTLIVVNGCGAILYICYTACFRHFAVQKLAISVQIVSAVSFFLTMLLFAARVNLETALNAFGFIGCGLVVFFMASPLANLGVVIRRGTTEVLPFPMIVCNFFLTAMWTLYGKITDDNFVAVPNFIGWCLAVVQLLFFGIYPSKAYQERLLP